MFREDSFDPTVRLRRGRFYSLEEQNKQYRPDRVTHTPFAVPTPWRSPTWDAATYQPWQPGPSAGDIVALGDGTAQSRWRLIDREQFFNGDTLVTLKLINPLAVLPELAEQALPGDRKDEITKAYERTVDTALRQLPVPTVDACREFVRIVLAAWPLLGCDPAGRDLAELIRQIPDDRTVFKSACTILARLHPRGKSAEHERQSHKNIALREITEADAEVAVGLAGLVLREIGWAA